MDITKLVAKPELTKVVLDDEEIIAEYNEPLEFYTWDRQPIDVFLNLSGSIGIDQQATVDTLKTLILDSNGNRVMTEDFVLPIKVMVKAMAKVMELLGK
jgi:hypothetical protein